MKRAPYIQLVVRFTNIEYSVQATSAPPTTIITQPIIYTKKLLFDVIWHQVIDFLKFCSFVFAFWVLANAHHQFYETGNLLRLYVRLEEVDLEEALEV